jgi:hypothetical protein
MPGMERPPAVSSSGAASRTIASWRRIDDYRRPRLGDQNQTFIEAPRATGAPPGGIDFALVNALACDPMEWISFAVLLGARKVVAIYEPADLAWWPGDHEPVALLLLRRRGLLWFGLYTGRSRDNRARRWARDPVERLCIVRGVRAGQAARLIAHAFGLVEVPRVPAR